ncbi:MAG: glycosyltransferase [Chloroflexi bacterium]|nr:glycosyltransferase [Chloroflexota bacterium]
MRVAIVHDWLNQYGGAERVLEALHHLYPDAPVYTSLYAPEGLPAAYRAWDIRTSFMQRLPLAKQRHQPFLPLYPLAFERFDLSGPARPAGGYDLVISNSSGFCHSVPTPPETLHINYCLTPPRFLWSPEGYLAREQVPGLVRRLLPAVIGPLRRWDAVTASRRVDYFVAISQAVRERILSCYGREAVVIYPPVDTSAFGPSDRVGDFYLVASRLAPYKRVDLAVRAFTALGLPLVVAGEGRDRRALEALAGPSVRFEGWVSQERLRELYATCRAFVFPGEEDFGIAPLEAGASGRPVIAYAAGGALDTVVEGVTGVFFHQQTPESLVEAVRRLERLSFDPQALRRHAQGFDTAVFQERFTAHVAACLAERRAASGGLPVPA